MRLLLGALTNQRRLDCWHIFAKTEVQIWRILLEP
jgi:hypothetical protein